MPATRLKNLSIIAFFGVQLYLALPGLVFNRIETEGRFSWNMYAVDHACKVRYDLITPEARRHTINYRQFFNNPSRANMVFRRDDLPQFNRYLCDAMRERGSLGTIRASVACTLNDRPPIELLRLHADICTAPNGGVIPR